MNIEKLEAREAQLKKLHKAAQGRADAILDECLEEGRSMEDDEKETVAEARSEAGNVLAELEETSELLEELRQAQADLDAQHPTAVTDDVEERQADADTARSRAVSVNREPLTYQRSNQQSTYLHDLVLIEKGYGRGDPVEAKARLERHAAEMRVEAPRLEERMWGRPGDHPTEIRSDGERRSVSVEYEKRDLDRTDGTGGYFVPPIWMMQDYIDLSRGARVIADTCNRFPLPAGTDSINVPKVATGTTTAIQTADNAAVSETDLTDTSVQANVKTIAGQQDLSLQAFEQSPLAFDQIILEDLASDHAVKTDVQVINGSDASGQVLGILNISSVDTTAYTDASPTVPELYPKIADSWQQIAKTRFRVPQAIFMTPTRWAWWLASVDSSNRPLVVPQAQGPDNALASFNANAAEGGPVGTLPFGQIIVDPNIPQTLGGGTEDVIILTRPSELYLWEGPVRTRVLTEVLSGTLTVRIQLYNYLAFMPHRRPESTSLVAGTGLAAPTF